MAAGAETAQLRAAVMAREKREQALQRRAEAAEAALAAQGAPAPHDGTAAAHDMAEALAAASAGKVAAEARLAQHTATGVALQHKAELLRAKNHELEAQVFALQARARSAGFNDRPQGGAPPHDSPGYSGGDGPRDDVSDAGTDDASSVMSVRVPLPAPVCGTSALVSARGGGVRQVSPVSQGCSGHSCAGGGCLVFTLAHTSHTRAGGVSGGYVSVVSHHGTRGPG